MAHCSELNLQLFLIWNQTDTQLIGDTILTNNLSSHHFFRKRLFGRRHFWNKSIQKRLGNRHANIGIAIVPMNFLGNFAIRQIISPKGDSDSDRSVNRYHNRLRHSRNFRDPSPVFGSRLVRLHAIAKS